MGANIGQAVFNVAALVVSYYFSPIAGALVSAAGQALFPAGSDVKGPRAQDQGFTTSQAGLDIPLVIGTQKVAGNIIWAAPLVEHKKSESAKGGQPKAITYTYTRSFSILLCEGEIAAVRRIWRNGKLIYDRTPKRDDESSADFTSRIVAAGKFDSSFRVYLGSEDQLPDPLQEADNGIGNVPAYRGTAYVTFENHDITDMGARVPNFEFEVVETGELITNAPNEYSNEAFYPWVKPSWNGDPRACKNDHQYRFHYTDSSTTYRGPWRDATADAFDDALGYIGGIAKLIDSPYPAGSYIGWNTVDQHGVASPFVATDPVERIRLELYFINPDAQTMLAADGGAFYDIMGISQILGAYCKNGYAEGIVPGFTDPDIWYWTGWQSNGVNVGSGSGAYSRSSGVYWFGYGFPAGVIDWKGLSNCIHPYQPEFGRYPTIFLAPDIRLEVKRIPSPPGTLCNPRCGEAHPLLPEDPRYCVIDSDLVYAAAWQKVDDATNWKILIDPLPYYAPDGSLANLPAIPDFDPRYNDQKFWEALAEWAKEKGIDIPFDPLNIKPIYGSDYPITKTSVPWKVLQKYVEGVFVSTDVSKYPLSPAIPSFDDRYNDAAFWQAAYTAAQVEFGTIYPQGMPGGLTYGTDYPVAQSYAYTRVPPDLGTILAAEVTLAYAVSVISARCNLSADQLDVSELTETLHGMRVTANTTGRACIEQLKQYGFFDSVEVDGLLSFPLRGKAAVATLGEDDLGAHAPGEDTPPLVTLERTEPAELPRTVNVSYDDVDGEYQTGQQSSTWLTNDASSAQEVTFSIAMNSAKAAQIADVAIADIWLSRESVKLSAMPNWLNLSAGDAIEVPLEGRTERVRIVSSDMPLPAGAIAVEAVRDDASVYVSNRLGTPTSIKPQPIGLIGPTQMVVMDTAALRESDNDAGVYVALYGVTNGWHGGTLEISVDGQATWSPAGDVILGATVGAVDSSLDFTTSFVFDDATKIEITLPASADLQSITDQQVLNYGNVCAIGNETGWEILQFATHINNGDGTRTLSRLLRGRKGTEWKMNRHSGDEKFVMLGQGVIRLSLGNAMIGKTVYLRATSYGLDVASATVVSFVPRGVGLLPYSPTFARLTTIDASTHQVRVEWARRTRLSGEWQDNAEVPLNEAAEAYRLVSEGSEMTFYATEPGGLGHPVVTVTPLVPGKSISFQQISDIVGAGYSYTETLDS